MFRTFVGIILGIFLIAILGSILLETFPQLQPLWEEFKEIVVGLYEASQVKYGAVATVAIIIGLFVVFGTSRKI